MRRWGFLRAQLAAAAAAGGGDTWAAECPRSGGPWMYLSKGAASAAARVASAAPPRCTRSTRSVGCVRWRSKCSRAATGDVISCGVLLAADGAAGAHELNGGGVCSCSAPLAEGKVVLVQGGCGLSGGEGSHGGFSLLRARRVRCSAGRCCWWAAGAQGRRHALVRVPLDVWRWCSCSACSTWCPSSGSEGSAAARAASTASPCRVRSKGFVRCASSRSGRSRVAARSCAACRHVVDGLQTVVVWPQQWRGRPLQPLLAAIE